MCSTLEKVRLSLHASPEGPIMATDLTDREREVLDFIISRTRAKGAPPTIREIGTAFQIASTNGVRYYLASLERKGCILRNRRLSRGIEIVGGVQPASAP